MNYKIDRTDLMKLVASTKPAFHYFDHPLYKDRQWPERIGEREVKILESLDVAQLFNLYQLSKNSYWTVSSKGKAEENFLLTS